MNIIPLFVLIFGCSTVGMSLSVNVKAVPPIYHLEVKNVACYEATIPIFFHVELPKFVEIHREPSIDCSWNDKNETQVEYCELEEQFSAGLRHIMKDLQTLRMQFGQQEEPHVTHRQDVQGVISRRKRQATPVVAATSLLAGFLMRPAISKFTGKLFGSDDDWNDHFNAIRQSLIQEHELLLNFEQATHSYTQELDRILTNMSALMTQQKRDLLWSLRLLAVKTHMDIIQDSILSCKSKHIPANLIEYKILRQKLAEIDGNLRNFNYTLAIDLDNLGKYFKLPIADCLFTPTKAHITVNIPLKTVGAEWELHEVVHTKYAFNNQVCELYPQEAAYLAVSKSDLGNRTVLITNHMLKYCSIYEHQLCMIPQFTKESVQSLRCVAGGMYENLGPDELAKVCSFRCYSSDEVIITQVSDTKIVVTNAVNLTYQCGKNEPEQVVHVGRLGALEVNMNCDCSIIINGREQLTKPFPCITNSFEKNFGVNLTVPILWTHNFTDLTNFTEHHGNLNRYVNYNWPRLIPVLNFTKEKLDNFTVPEKVVQSSSPLLTVEAWLGLLTLVVALQIIFTLYCFFKILMVRYGSYDLPPVHAHHHHKNPDDSDSDSAIHHSPRCESNYSIAQSRESNTKINESLSNQFTNRLI